MATITDFIANFQNGARPNRFRVLLTFPFGGTSTLSLNASISAALGPISVGGGVSLGNPNQLFQFMCKGASLPPEQVGTVEVPFLGRTYKVAGDRTFPDWSCTVTNDENFTIRNAFEQWSNIINGHESNARSVAGNLYFSTAQVQQLAVDNATVLKTYTINNMFPTEVSDITLGFDQNDSIEEFTVNFAYSHWTSDTTT